MGLGSVLLSGSGTREVVVARNTVSVSGADITPMGDNGFIGRVLPREDGYTGKSVECEHHLGIGCSA